MGKLVEKYEEPKVLNADRVGDAVRHAKSIEAQAGLVTAPVRLTVRTSSSSTALKTQSVSK
jgi:hypothetical protein